MSLYKPSINWALNNRKIVLVISCILLISTLILFLRMGAEFVPTLDEGDFVIQPVLKTGTSLSMTIETITKMEKIIKQFPEVKDVVSRIGAAEVPTDPMSMEESDVIITLNPRSEWVSANSKDELADKLKEALSIIPGIDYEFTQPIEMRFNELITGVRADLAIKIFGEDLDILYKKAKEVEAKIQNIEGASDIIVEKTAGLPQMSVIYNRQKIAKYGLNVEELNNVITMGFAGATAGTIFEGEKQFDLVVRFDDAHRKSIDDLKAASIMLPSGQSLPLSEFAEIKITKSPAKISRDETRRRIVIGVNVRNRDLTSVVEDVQKIIKEQINLPVGYSISYGGQFENLQNASSRLMVAVPIALFLIFVMLHFAFGSFKDAIMIFSAIPFAAVGGILLLVIRGLPFSISAGVGFIALFGIAVLNGIVLIEHLNELKQEGVKDIRERIIMGTKDRLRPVLLTAGAAALGFLPMAISTSSGAEVQRPLATVVIGGLISATLLTMIVLPVLYYYFDKKFKSKIIKAIPISFLLAVILLLPNITNGQSEKNITTKQYLNISDAIKIAVENNAGLKASSLMVKKSESNVGASLDFPKTEFYYNYDESNMGANELPLKVWGVNQSIKFPTVYFSQRNLNKEIVKAKKQKYQLNEILLKREVSELYYSIIYLKNVEQEYKYMDSLFTKFAKAAQVRYKVGETNKLEELTALAKKKGVEILLSQTEEKIKATYSQLQSWLQTDSTYIIEEIALPILEINSLDETNNPGLHYYENLVNTSASAVSLEKQNLLPDINFGMFQGNNSGANTKTYYGFDVSVSIPILFFGQSSKIESAQLQKQVVEQNYKNYEIKLNAKIKSLHSELKSYESSVHYYQTTGKQLSKQLLNNANKAFQGGEIDFLQYIQLIQNSVSIEMNYLENLNKYNQTVLSLNYLVLNEL